MARMSIDNKLGLDAFRTDEENPHIVINEDFKDEAEIKRVVMACPAELYKYENGELTFNHEGCLECGTCRVLSIDKVVKTWTHPGAGYGIQYRLG